MDETSKALQMIVVFAFLAGVVIGVFATRGPAAISPAAGIGAGEVDTTHIKDSAVTSTKIADGAVTTAKLAGGAVTSAKILDGTIATADIQDGAVTSAKIADGTVSTNDIEDEAITEAKISDGAVTNSKLGSGSVTSSEVADNTLTAADLKVPPGSATYVVATSTDNGDYDNIQDAINALPHSGGLVYIKEGVYETSTTITITRDNVSLVGSGTSTVIRVIGAIDGIEVTGVGVLIANLYIVGDGTNAEDGIQENNSQDSVVRDVLVENFTSDGIELSGGSRITVKNNYIFNNDECGINASGTDNSLFVNNTISFNGWDGVRINDDADNNLVASNLIFNNDVGVGIRAAACDSNAVISNYYYANPTDGLVDSGTNTQQISTSDISGLSISNENIYGLLITLDNIENINDSIIGVDNIENLKISEENIENFVISSANIENLTITSENISGKINWDNLENVTIGVDNIYNDNINPSVVAFTPGSASYVVATDSENGDYTDIQTAINALPSTGGMVHVKEGTYTITSTISITGENISLIGSGSGTVIRVTGAIDGITASGVGLTMADLYLVGDGESAVDGLQLNNLENSVIRNVWVENFTSDGMELSGGQGVVVRDSFVWGNANNGILIWDTDNSLITNNMVYQNSWDGIRIDGNADNNLVTSNYVFSNDKGITVNNANCDNNALGINYANSNATADLQDSGTDTRFLSVETQSGQAAVGDGDTVTFAPHFPGTPNVVVSSENWERRVGVENITAGQFNVWVIRVGDNTPLPTTEDAASNIQWIAVYHP